MQKSLPKVSKLSDWARAQLYRKLAANAKSHKQRIKLYALAQHYEKKANYQPEVGSPLTAQPTDEPSYRLPVWFKEAKSNLQCSNCKGKRGCYWYTRVGDNYTRVRMIPAVKKGNMDRVKMLMDTSTALCRRCANES